MRSVVAGFDRRDLERLRFAPGQALLSRDFRDQAAVDEQLRWWHVRGVHGAFGVALGLALVPDRKNPIFVAPGLAFDAFGRELLLGERREIPPLPTAAGSAFTLMLRRLPDSGPSQDLTGACLGAPPVSTGNAELVWVPSSQLSPADGVPLARFAKGAWDPDFRPPQARALARPRVASGATLVGGTSWELWEETLQGPNGHKLALGVQVWVDTRTAGFTAPPCVFVSVLGNDPQSEGGAFSVPEAEHVARTTTQGFLFRTRVGTLQQTGPGSISASSQLFSARLSFAVCWLAVQMPASPFSEVVHSEVIHGHS
jgi:hypothetical protein